MAIRNRGFTLIELLVVISIIAVLLALLFPVARGVLDRAKNTQAKNDVTQIVTAVNAFYTEYGKYPAVTTPMGGATSSNKALFNALRGLDPQLNPRAIAFINPPNAKDSTHPRNGIGPTGSEDFYDPWGTPYAIEIDDDYDEQVPDPYDNGKNIHQGVIAWSIGKNKDATNTKDAIASWQ